MTLASLLGPVRLRPGRRPAITRTLRPGWAAAVARGRPAAQLPDLMAAAHALCAHGHRLAAGMAVQAAQGLPTTPDAASRRTWRLAVLREQALRIAHDWPRLLGSTSAAALPLAGAPLWQPGLAAEAQLAQLPGWLATHWLGGPLAELLPRLADERATLHWARSGHTALAQLLAACLPPALALRTAHRPLRLPAALQPGDAAVPDTGPWARQHAPQAPAAHNAGMRLIARLADLLQLAAPAGGEWLHAEACSPAPGAGRAWVEVGRGLLGYELQLDERGQVRDLHIVSPTDWNFHPAGVLAEALAQVEHAADARCLAVAFDPCVPFEIEAVEAAHA